MSEVGGVPQDEREWTIAREKASNYEAVIGPDTRPLRVQPVSVAAGLRTELEEAQELAALRLTSIEMNRGIRQHFESELAERDRQLEQLREAAKVAHGALAAPDSPVGGAFMAESILRAALSVEPDTELQTGPDSHLDLDGPDTSRPHLPEGQPSDPDIGNDQ